MRKVGHTSEFLFGTYWWTWKTNNYLKNCWSGPINIVIQYCISLKRKKKNISRYHYQNLADMIHMIHSSWDIEQNILKFVILGPLLPFYPHKNSKTKTLRNEKICWRYHHFTHVPKITIIWCTVLEIWSETGRVFCHFGRFFSFSDPCQPRKSTF